MLIPYVQVDRQVKLILDYVYQFLLVHGTALILISSECNEG